jgi:tripeptidyl-peptidase-1
LNQFVAPSDLQTFYKQFDSGSLGRTLKYSGPNKQNNPGIEASLDVQYGSSMAFGVPSVWFWSTAGQQPGNPGNEPFLVWLYGLGNTSTVPYIFSMSYGDNENTVIPNYALRVNQEFQKMGVRGISLLASSGDGGVAGSQPTQCKKFIPTFPAASPFVTAVGGTTGSSPEVAGPLSGGGFSNYWAQPSYQTAAVNQYFKVAKNLPPATDYNRTGAAFPDVASQAYNFPIVVDGSTMGVDGTSCASPVFSGIVALLNDIRLNNNKAPLGWLNPLFYANPTAFNDITTGDNPGCSTQGFHAAVGWDPVTGLGSMNYQAWAAIIQKLP